jgi:cellulose biosynthesis protein BcsQ
MTKALIISSEKGGAGKTTIAVNIAAFLSHITDKTILLFDGDITNQSATRQMLPSLRTEKMAELEDKEMLMTTEKMIRGLLKHKTHMIAHDEILHPVPFAHKLKDTSDPLSIHIFDHLPEEIKDIFTNRNIDEIDIDVLSEALATGLTEVLYMKDLFQPAIMEKKYGLNKQNFYGLEEETYKLLQNIKKMDQNTEYRMKTNKAFLNNVYPQEFLIDHGLTPAEAFGKLGFKATPISSLGTQTLYIIPSKGREPLNYRYQPNAIVSEMNTLNDSLLVKYDIVIYDSEATSNILKSVLISLENVEMVSVVTPSNLAVELDMLQKYRSEVEIRGIIVNNALPEHIQEVIQTVNTYNIPLISIIPLDLENKMAYLTHQNKLVVGTASNIDYAIRIAALNLFNRKKIDKSDIMKIFTNAESVYETMMNKKNVILDPDSENEKTQTSQKNQSKSNKGFLSGLMSKLGTNVNKKQSRGR